MDWQTLIETEKNKPYFVQMQKEILKIESEGISVFPLINNRFRAFDLSPFEQTRVVIMGQDPYHGVGQAHGLSFSVLPGVKIPPSLGNIYKELNRSIKGFTSPSHGFLENWAKQGILMLNRVLSVEASSPHSHRKLGWEKFTTKMIEALINQKSGIIFLLWGNSAQDLENEINLQNQIVLKSSHPSPLSAHRGFLGCNHFVEVNKILKSRGEALIQWNQL